MHGEAVRIRERQGWHVHLRDRRLIGPQNTVWECSACTQAIKKTRKPSCQLHPAGIRIQPPYSNTLSTLPARIFRTSTTPCLKTNCSTGLRDCQLRARPSGTPGKSSSSASKRSRNFRLNASARCEVLSGQRRYQQGRARLWRTNHLGKALHFSESPGSTYLQHAHMGASNRHGHNARTCQWSLIQAGLSIRQSLLERLSKGVAVRPACLADNSGAGSWLRTLLQLLTARSNSAPIASRQIRPCCNQRHLQFCNDRDRLDLLHKYY